MNPVRTLGPAVAAGNYKQIWIYLVAPTAGAVAGAAVYTAVKLKGDDGEMPRRSFRPTGYCTYSYHRPVLFIPSSQPPATIFLPSFSIAPAHSFVISVPLPSSSPPPQSQSHPPLLPAPLCHLPPLLNRSHSLPVVASLLPLLPSLLPLLPLLAPHLVAATIAAPPCRCPLPLPTMLLPSSTSAYRPYCFCNSSSSPPLHHRRSSLPSPIVAAASCCRGLLAHGSVTVASLYRSVVAHSSVIVAAFLYYCQLLLQIIAFISSPLPLQPLQTVAAISSTAATLPLAATISSHRYHPWWVISLCFYLLYILPCSNNYSRNPRQSSPPLVAQPPSSSSLLSLPTPSHVSIASFFLPDHYHCHQSLPSPPLVD
ncbi:hypothetical protein B296_00049738 [Ensete ventricosum]|uniref:Aquaporin n=1 Tax=Ensete ventricosum TaxID=4639 RepID=A0A426X696_ENSVE|nr:hypothetical protein B296_00049738 [Ensete ventricosum]